MTKIQDYDSVNYDYREYWRDREYENLSEVNILKKIIKEGKNFIDVGGAYGRLTPIYQDKFKYSILFDYSYKNLKRAKVGSNVFRVCGDIYNLPFKDNSIEGGMCVRVMHHIESPELAIKELSRVISSDFYLEFANKNNFLALIRSKFSSKYRRLNTIKIQHKKDSQGFIEDQVFLNFSPKFIKKIINPYFEIKEEYSVSNFRQKILKNIFPLKFLIFLDNLFQSIFKIISFGPSIFLKLEKKSREKFILKDIEDILICPKCKSDLSKTRCPKCKIDYLDKVGIFNFRLSHF